MIDAREPLDEAEVVVVGGGPAGASCAAALAERGRDVLIVDQDEFPREKPCGDGLSALVVDHLREAGLDDLADGHQPVEGARMIYEHRHVRQVSFEEKTARCITRAELDQRLLEHALACGTRFRRARATGLVPASDGGDRFAGVELAGRDGGAWIRARHIVAADGATSRLRRACGFGKPRPIEAYAVRTYVTVENPLDPFFEAHVPIEHEGWPLPGYGWVFPLDEHRANVGIGYYRGSGFPAVPRLSELLGEFVETLRTRAQRRFGDVETDGRQIGSPVGISFAPEFCERGNVLFAGDAARTADPYTAEGIGNAIKSGRAVALALDARIRGRNGAGPPMGLMLARRFPRLVQNPAGVVRLGTRAWEELEDIPEVRPGEFPPAFRRSLVRNDFDPGVRGTPVWELLDRVDPAARDALERVAPRCLDAFRTTFPFTSEMLQRELKARTGPSVAALSLLVARAGGEPPSPATELAALASQALALSRPFLMNVTDEATQTFSKLNNAVSLLIVDYAVSRGWRIAAKLGGTATKEVGSVGRRIAEGIMLDFEDLFSLERTPERCVDAARATAAEVYGLAAALGADAAELEPITRDALRRYAVELGTAFQIAGDTCDFFIGEEITGKTPGADVLAGIYSLPVAHALTKSRDLRRALTRGVRNGDMPRIIELVRDGGAVDHAREVCELRVTSARAALEASGVDDTSALSELADLPLRQLYALDEASVPAYVGD